MVYQQAINKAWLNRYAELYKDDGFEVEWMEEQRFVASKVFHGVRRFITVYIKYGYTSSEELKERIKKYGY